MKKIFSLAAVLLSSFALFAFPKPGESDWNLSLEPIFGIKNGQVNEYVYTNNSNFSDDKLSELNWEIKPELYLGGKIYGGWRQIFGQFHFTAGIPMKSGSMIDKDWLNCDPASVTWANAQGHDYQTHYSEHDNYLNYDINLSIKAGYDFKVLSWLNIKPALAFEYQNIKFTGSDGSASYGGYSDGYYAPYDDPEDSSKKTFSGNVISYKRISSLFWLGSDFAFTLPAIPHLPGFFIIDAGFFTSLYAYAESFDSHLLKNIDFADKTEDFFGAFKWNVGLTYQFNQRHSFSFGTTFFYLRELRGTNYTKKSSDSAYSKNSAADGGASAFWCDFAFSYKFRIF